MAGFMQVGVVPIVRKKNKPHVVLVTASGKGRWLLPKGNPHPRHTRRQMALTEAYEEAGVVGAIRVKHFVDVPFRKDSRRIRLRLYPMDVEQVLKKWPEQGRRNRVVVDARKAGKLLRCKWLSAGVERLVCAACS